jgi:hypothetical protein
MLPRSGADTARSIGGRKGAREARAAFRGRALYALC